MHQNPRFYEPGVFVIPSLTSDISIPSSSLLYPAIFSERRSVLSFRTLIAMLFVSGRRVSPACRMQYRTSRSIFFGVV